MMFKDSRPPFFVLSVINGAVAIAASAIALLNFTAYAAEVSPRLHHSQSQIALAQVSSPIIVTPTPETRPSNVLLEELATQTNTTPVDDEVAEEESLANSTSTDLVAAHELSLRANYALLIDRTNDQVIYNKNADASVPIASITKLMTALVIMNSGLDLEQNLRVERQDLVGSGRKKLRVGTVMPRRAFLKLALMSSDNVAAHVLGRTYKNGLNAFVKEMNNTAQNLKMSRTRFVEPTGLESDNHSSPWDLVKLLDAAQAHPMIRSYSTSESQKIKMGRRLVNYHSSNGLVRSGRWSIDIQKTGFINKAGRCLVMQFRLHDRPFVAVLLDSRGKTGRIIDSLAIRSWLEQHYAPLAQIKSAPVIEVARSTTL